MDFSFFQAPPQSFDLHKEPINAVQEISLRSLHAALLLGMRRLNNQSIVCEGILNWYL